MPHVIGAIDGKHIEIKCPRNSHSVYYNYKGYYSIVLLAIVSYDYKFMWVDVGANGSASDTSIFNRSELKRDFENGNIGLPTGDSLPNDNRITPYFLLGDDAFALTKWLVKPYPHRGLNHDERIFNYRLSHVRPIV